MIEQSAIQHDRSNDELPIIHTTSDLPEAGTRSRQELRPQSSRSSSQRRRIKQYAPVSLIVRLHRK